MRHAFTVCEPVRLPRQKFKKLTRKPLERKTLLPPHQLEMLSGCDGPGEAREREQRATRKLLDDISNITEIAEKELRQKVALVSVNLQHFVIFC